jgi:hypothetical protein
VATTSITICYPSRVTCFIPQEKWASRKKEPFKTHLPYQNTYKSSDSNVPYIAKLIAKYHKKPAKLASQQLFPLKAMTCRPYLIFLIQDTKSYSQEPVQRHAHAQVYKEITKHVSFD